MGRRRGRPAPRAENRPPRELRTRRLPPDSQRSEVAGPNERAPPPGSACCSLRGPFLSVGHAEECRFGATEPPRGRVRVGRVAAGVELVPIEAAVVVPVDSDASLGPGHDRGERQLRILGGGGLQGVERRGLALLVALEGTAPEVLLAALDGWLPAPEREPKASKAFLEPGNVHTIGGGERQQGVTVSEARPFSHRSRKCLRKSASARGSTGRKEGRPRKNLMVTVWSCKP